jgi:hypothetical protein
VREKDLTRSMLDRELGAGGRAGKTAGIGATMSYCLGTIFLLTYSDVAVLFV